AEYFTRVPEERRRHLSMAGGLPLEVLLEETQASRRFRKVRGLSGLGAIARAVAVDRLDVGFVDILPCEGCLDHPLLGPRDELFRRRQIVGATEPGRSPTPPRWDARRSGRALPTSTSRPGRRSFKRRWTGSRGSPPTGCCVTASPRRSPGATAPAIHSRCCSWIWTTSRR